MRKGKNTSAMAVAPSGAVRTPGGGKWRYFKENYPFLVMLLPAVVVVFLFNYLPIYGVLIAFQDFMPGDKILSDTTIWVGFNNFIRFFTDPQFWPLMGNTFLLCILGFVIGFPLPIIIALMLNALAGKRTKKFLQTIFTAPHFISLVVLVGMLQLFFGRYGLVNNIVANLGANGSPTSWKTRRFVPSTSCPATGRTSVGVPSSTSRPWLTWTPDSTRRPSWTALPGSSGCFTSTYRPSCP